MIDFVIAWYAMGWVTAALLVIDDCDAIELGFFIGNFFLWPLFFLIIAIGALIENWNKKIVRKYHE